MGMPCKGRFMMKKVDRSLVVFVFVIIVSVLPFNTALAQIGAYVGVFGNYDPIYDLDVQQTGIFGVKIGGTHPEIKNSSFEFEYSYLNPDVNRTVLTTAGTDYSAIQGNIKIHNFMFNAIVKYPEGKIHPYLGLGIGVSYFDLSLISTSRLNGVNYSERHSFNNAVFAWQVLTGVDIDLTNNFSIDIGCRYFDSESKVYYYDHYNKHDHDDYYNDGPTPDFSTFIVTLGLKFRF
jgi:opacity protein-like surface antigen